MWSGSTTDLLKVTNIDRAEPFILFVTQVRLEQVLLFCQIESGTTV